MKTARLFFVGMYLHLALSIVTHIGFLVLDGNTNEWSRRMLACVYLLEAVLAALAGWICVVMGVVASGQRHMGRLVMGWRLLKLKTIPFYVLNFLWSAAVWGVFIITRQSVPIPLLAVPLGLTCLFVFQSGCLGISLVHTMRRHGDGPSALHYLGQILPLADIVSTLFLLRVLHVDNIN